MSGEVRELINDSADEQVRRKKPKKVIRRLTRPSSKVQKRQARKEKLNLSPLSKSKPLSKLEEQSAREGGFTKWQTVIWREWCRCKDPDYAYYLFELVKSTAFGRNFVVILALLGVLIGAVLGYLMGSMFDTSGLQNIGFWDLSGLPPLLLAFTMGIAGGTLGLEGSRRFRTLYFWWQGQPSATRVEWALRQAIAHYPGAAQVWAEPMAQLEQQKDNPPAPDSLIEALRSSDWQERFVARRVLVSLGGEAVEPLREIAVDRTNPLWDTALWLLGAIEQETTNQFAWRVNRTVCPHCLTRFDGHSIDVGLGVPFTCYACRVCGQGRQFFHLPQGVVAVLNTNWTDTQTEQDGLLQVNWLARRDLFDFDWVEIIEATDEDVERFAVQVGNDTDPFRKPRYKHMYCFIGPDCELSENTLRILRRTFGEVKRE